MMTKQAQIVNSIINDIKSGVLEPGAEILSARELVAEFGVARQTARSAIEYLRNHGFVCANGNRRDKVAGEASKAVRVGVLVSGCGYTDIFPVICRQIEQFGFAEGIEVIVKDSSSKYLEQSAADAITLAKELIEMKVAGVIMQPVQFSEAALSINEQLMEMFTEAGIHMVLIDCDISDPPPDGKYDVVSIDNYRAGRELAERLLSRGARQIRFQTNRCYAESISERIRGVRSVVRPGGDPVMIVNPADRVALKRKLREDPSIDAIICQNDIAAVMMIESLRVLGYRVPADIIVAGFDDVANRSKTKYPLLTARQPCRDLASTAYTCLRGRMRFPNVPSCKILIHAPIISHR